MARGLTPPSSGRLTAGCAVGKPPLMSNVRHHSSGGSATATRAPLVACRGGAERPSRVVFAASLAVQGSWFGEVAAYHGRRGPSVRWRPAHGGRRIAGRMQRPAGGSSVYGLRRLLEGAKAGMEVLQPKDCLREASAGKVGAAFKRWRVQVVACEGELKTCLLVPNPSIERTPYSQLRWLPVAAHVER
jgi:hypothetical protein